MPVARKKKATTAKKRASAVKKALTPRYIRTMSDEILEFVQMLRVPDGAFAGQRLVLRDWQIKIIREAFDDPNLRRLIISWPRKNAKTVFAAIILLAALVGPLAQLNSQIYSAAQSREQAAIVFGYACKMVQMTPELQGLVIIRESKKELFCPATGVTYRALSADATTAYGYSPRLSIHDELGQVIGPVSKLYDALETASGAQASPLSIVISTQAMSDSDLLSTLIDDALTGKDPTTKLFLCCADMDDDITDPAVWEKANPALGDFMNYAEFKALADRANRMPSFEPTFRNLNLNQRVSAGAHFMTPTVWKLNGREPDPSVMQRFPVHLGLDLSARQDLTAAVATCQDEDNDVHVFPYFWTPAQTLKDRAKRDKAPYDVWVDKGFMFAIPGVSIDYKVVAEWLVDFCGINLVVSIRFDRWRIDELKRELAKLGAAGDHVIELLIEHGQGFRDMAPAIDKVEQLALQGRLRHGMHPVLTWNVSNSVITKDPAGNRKLDKSKTTGRIDGAVGLVMGTTGLSDEDTGDSYLANYDMVYVV